MKQGILVGGLILASFLMFAFTLPGAQIDPNITPTLIPSPDTVDLTAVLQTDSQNAEGLAQETPLPSDDAPSTDGAPLVVAQVATDVPIGTEPTVLPAAEKVITTTLRDLGEGNLALNGLYSAGSIWIPLPSNWVVEYILVDLKYSASPLLHSERASMTVMVNSQRVTSFRLLRGDHIHSFSIDPLYVAQGNGFLFAFEGYLRLTDMFCEETDNPGQWVSILNETAFTFGVSFDRRIPSLATMGTALLPQNAIDPPPPLLFVLPDNPDSVTLTTAAQVAARIGQQRGFATVDVTTASALTEQDMTGSNMVIIGQPENQPIIEQFTSSLVLKLRDGVFLSTEGTPIPPEHGVVEIFRSPWNDRMNILLVSAGSADGLRLAGQVFADSRSFTALTGAYQVIETLQIENRATADTPWLASQATLLDFGYTDRVASGTGTSGLTYYLRWPPGWVLRRGSQLTLNIATSPAIRAGSHMTVFINDVYIGATEIGLQNATTFVFELPEVLNNTLLGDRLRTMKLQVMAVNVLDAEECRQGDSDIAWTRIQANSFFTVLHDYAPTPNLQLFPYPFVSDILGQPVILVLPDMPDSEEIATALSFALRFGNYALDDVELTLLPADQLDQAAYGNANLLVLGEYARQPWVDGFLTLLSPTVTEDAYKALETKDAGLLLEQRSPWNAERVLLMVTGESMRGVNQTANALFTIPPSVDSEIMVIFDEVELPPPPEETADPESTESPFPLAEETVEPESTEPPDTSESLP